MIPDRRTIGEATVLRKQLRGALRVVEALLEDPTGVLALSQARRFLAETEAGLALGWSEPYL